MPKRELWEGWGTPPGVFCKNVILKGLGVHDAQECETEGVVGAGDLAPRTAIEKEGVRGGRGNVMEQGSMELRVCQ